MKKEIKISLSHAKTANGQTFHFWSFLQNDVVLVKKVLTDKTKERFYNDIHVLLSAGVDIKTALELFYGEQERKASEAFFRQLTEAVIKGKGLSSAMSEFKGFSKYEIVSIKIGEETGQLASILKELSVFFSRKIKLKRQMISVFSYPAFLLTVTLGVLFFMLNNVVPMFAEIFERFGKDLPSFTLTIIHASEALKIYGVYFLFFILTTIVFFFSQRHKEWYRKYSSFAALRAPIFGALLHKVYLSRFCQSMQLLVSARIPLVESLALVEEMIEFYPIEKSINIMKKEIMLGSSLNESMAKHNLYDKRMVSLIKVSEEVNGLESMFGRLSKQYNEEVEFKTSILGALIEPMMILLIGLIVGVILIAMYQPLFNIGNILE